MAHIIGVMIGKEQARFSRQLSDGEFENLVDKVGGNLPSGYWAWHVYDLDNTRSMFYVEVHTLPIVLQEDWLPADPVECILRDFYRNRKETCEDCKKQLTVMEELAAYSLGDGICYRCREERYSCGR